jgi:ubiquitin thioesterase protein OTUB1
MNEETATSDYCTWYLRVVTAMHLKQDPDRFLPFIDQPGFDIPQFCQREVEPMGKECQHVQVLALAEAFGVLVKIEYLDGHNLVNGTLVQHTFGPDTAATHLTLLYRPGHYDIVYQKK